MEAGEEWKVRIGEKVNAKAVGGGGAVIVEIVGGVAEAGEVKAGFEESVEGWGGGAFLILGRGFGEAEGNGEVLSGEGLIQGDGAVL